MVYIGNAARYRVIGHLLCRSNSADAPAVDLDETNLSIVDHMPPHEGIVRGLATGKRDVPAASRKFAISFVGAAVKRLFQPSG